MYLIKHGWGRQIVKCPLRLSFLIGKKLSETVDMNFSGFWGDKKFTEVILSAGGLRE